MSNYKVENEKKKMRKEDLKKVLMSIVVGACVAFMSTLFEGLATFLKSHSTEIASGGVAGVYHAIKTFRV